VCETQSDYTNLFIIIIIVSFEIDWMDGYRPTLIKTLKNCTTHTQSHIIKLKRDNNC